MRLAGRSDSLYTPKKIFNLVLKEKKKIDERCSVCRGFACSLCVLNEGRCCISAVIIDVRADPQCRSGCLDTGNLGVCIDRSA